MRLTAPQSDPNTYVDAISFLSFFDSCWRTFLIWLRKVIHTSLFSLPETTICPSLLNSIFTGIESHYMFDDWLTRQKILTTKNGKLKEINTFLGTYIPGELRRFTKSDTDENDNDNTLRYLVEMLNTFNRVAALPNYTVNLKKWFIVLLISNLNPKNGHVTETIYLVEDMINNSMLFVFSIGMRKGGKWICHKPFMVLVTTHSLCRTLRVYSFRFGFFVKVTNRTGQRSFKGTQNQPSWKLLFNNQLYVTLSKDTLLSNIVVLKKVKSKNPRT